MRFLQAARYVLAAFVLLAGGSVAHAQRVAVFA